MSRRLLLAAGIVVVFLVGIALGEALHDNPSPSGQQTLTRPLRALPLAPAARETVTVTVQKP